MDQVEGGLRGPECIKIRKLRRIHCRFLIFIFAIMKNFAVAALIVATATATDVRRSTLLRSDDMTGTAATGPTDSMTGSADEVVASTGGTGATGGSPNISQKWLSNIHDSINDLKTYTSAKDQERTKVCSAEFASIKAEEQEEEAAEKDDRAKQKANLADALDSRIKGMGPMLNKLVGLQKQLKRHIDNVNLIFQAKYAQDSRDMTVASNAFEELMKHATEGNPKDSPIKVPQLPKMDLGFVETNVGTGVFAERLSSMQERLNRHLAVTVEEPQCADAHEAALALFHKGARYHEEIKQFFDAERKVLAAFREQLGSVLRSKMAKLAKLKAQSAKIRTAMKIPEVDMKKALGDALRAHEEIIHAACSQMDAHTASNGPKRATLINKANQCSEETGNGAGVRIGKESLAGKVNEMEKEVQETRKESGATGTAPVIVIEKEESKEKPDVVQKPEPIKGGNVITV